MMISVDDMKTGKQHKVKTRDGKKFQGILIDKDSQYLYLKNVKMGQRFCSVFTIPMKGLKIA